MVVRSTPGLGSREQHRHRLETDLFDVAIVGGGITGAGIALDAAARGLRVGLVEKDDFANGTSSRSSKLIHGGLRYLAQYEFRVTRESLVERQLMLGLAPHLIEAIPFIIPVYGGRRQKLRIATGLRLYDWLAGQKNTRRHQRLARTDLRRLAPLLRTDNLAAAYVYQDCRTNDSRLTIAVLNAAARYGATIANRVRAGDFHMENGRVTGFHATDKITGASFEVRARAVIVAGGVWLDRVIPPPDGQPRLQPSKGVHLTLPRHRLETEVALYVPTGVDDRLIFVIPWQDRVLVGTTDTPYHGDLDAPRATSADVLYLLNALNYAFPGVSLDESDVISVQAGLRPLLHSGKKSTTRASRRDRVFETTGGIIAIGGGKLTTYRRMAAHAVDHVVRRLHRGGLLPHQIPCPTDSISLLDPGSSPEPSTSRDVLAAAILPDAPVTLARHLVGEYGMGAVDVFHLATHANLSAPLSPLAPTIKAEVVYAARHEMANRVGDVLARRTRLALTLPDQARSLAPIVARLMAPELGWTDEEMTRQIAAYDGEARQFSIAAE